MLDSKMTVMTSITVATYFYILRRLKSSDVIRYLFFLPHTVFQSYSNSSFLSFQRDKKISYFC